MWDCKIVEGMEELPENMDIRAADKNPRLSTWPVRGTNQRLAVQDRPTPVQATGDRVFLLGTIS